MSLEQLPRTPLEHILLLFLFLGCEHADMWSLAPRAAGGVAQWGRSDAPCGGQRVRPDVGESPQHGPPKAVRVGYVASRQDPGGGGEGGMDPQRRGWVMVDEGVGVAGGAAAEATAAKAAAPAGRGQPPPTPPPPQAPKKPRKLRHFESSEEDALRPQPRPSPSQAQAQGQGQGQAPPQTLALPPWRIRAGTPMGM